MHAHYVTLAHPYRYIVRLPHGTPLTVKNTKGQMVVYETERIAQAMGAAFSSGGIVVDRWEWRANHSTSPE